MSNLTTQTKKINFIISLSNQTFDFKVFDRFLSENGTYIYILHDKDKKQDSNGLIVDKRPHIHCVIYLYQRTRLVTFLNRICEALNISINAVSIEVLKNDIGSIQYLLHLNDKDKYQYSMSNLVYNYDSEELKTILEAKNDCLSIDRVVYLCSTSKNKVELIQAIGFTMYHHYRNTILDIWYCYHSRD